jgi:hypothetical protein
MLGYKYTGQVIRRAETTINSKKVPHHNGLLQILSPLREIPRVTLSLLIKVHLFESIKIDSTILVTNS